MSLPMMTLTVSWDSLSSLPLGGSLSHIFLPLLAGAAEGDYVKEDGETDGEEDLAGRQS